MASCTYMSFFDDAIRGLIDVDNATYKVLLTTSTYVENQDTHLTRNDVTGEVAAGNGYTAGGNTATVTVTKNTAANTITISLGGTTWTTGAGQTLTARKAVWYVSTGTITTDRLVGVNDFVTDQIASNGGTLTLPASTITLTISAPA